MDVVGASKEETLTNWEVGETLFLLVGEFEDIGKNVNCGG